ncbi:kinase-like domain-containing protein [Gorgonomyces haynaldii]|nr:kinase-like domain-containing protein [Gorgonomyces haynaldii]
MLTAVKDKEMKEVNLEKTIIKGRWRVLSIIGRGAFGQVYLAFDQELQQKVAIKIESPYCKKPVLKLEMSILKRHCSKHLCEMIAGGRFISPGFNESLNPPIYTYMVMKLLGQSLSELRKLMNGSFSVHTTALLGMQMIQAIKDVHEAGILHRDIKPGNFCIATADGPTDRHGRPIVYLIDFGLARRYRNEDGSVRAPRDQVGFRGTARYASIPAHTGQELGRVDDLWSLFYVLVEFQTGVLPWKGREKDVIGKVKVDLHGPGLVSKLPKPMLSFFEYLSQLEYQDCPDYHYLVGLMQELFALSNQPPDVPYDWTDVPSVHQDKEETEIVGSMDKIEEAIF